MIEEVRNRLAALLHGRIPEKFDLEILEETKNRDLGETVNQLIEFVAEIQAYIVPLSQGKLKDLKFHSRNFLASPFKEFHSRLLHLTWQATQVAKGDYGQRVDFMGEFSEAFNAMVKALDENQKLLRKKIEELEQSLAHIKKLEGILPICAYCKKIRVESPEPEQKDRWVQIENYISDSTEARFSHGVCPECYKKILEEG